MLKQFVGCAVGVLLFTSTTESHACQDGPSSVGVKMGAGRICWQPFVDWAHNHLRMRDFDGGWGYEDPCNIGLPYGKVMLSAWLLAFALPNDAVRPLGGGLGDGMQFHGRVDYRRLVHWAGQSNIFHDDQEVNAEDRTDKVAHYDGSAINLNCPLFDSGNTMSSPMWDSSALVHESWHSWQRGSNRGSPIDAFDRIVDNNHTKPGGDCTLASCDVWFDHHPYWFAYEDLHQYILPNGVPPFTFHQTMQVEAEWACDVALYLSDPSPGEELLSVADSARAVAFSRMSTAFRWDPGYRCDSPHMFSWERAP